MHSTFMYGHYRCLLGAFKTARPMPTYKYHLWMSLKATKGLPLKNVNNRGAVIVYVLTPSTIDI